MASNALPSPRCISDQSRQPGRPLHCSATCRHHLPAPPRLRSPGPYLRVQLLQPILSLDELRPDAGQLAATLVGVNHCGQGLEVALARGRGLGGERPDGIALQGECALYVSHSNVQSPHSKQCLGVRAHPGNSTGHSHPQHCVRFVGLAMCSEAYNRQPQHRISQGLWYGS